MAAVELQLYVHTDRLQLHVYYQEDGPTLVTAAALCGSNNVVQPAKVSVLQA